MKISPWIAALVCLVPAFAESEDSGLIPVSQRKSVVGFVAHGKGKPVRIADLKGQIVLVDFWTTWCPPCRQSLPELAQLQRKGKEKGTLTVLPVNMDENRMEVLPRFVSKNAKVLGEFQAYSPGLGKEGIGANFGQEITAYPTTYLIDPEGRIAWRWTGYGKGLLVDRINQLLRELQASAAAR